MSLSMVADVKQFAHSLVPVENRTHRRLQIESYDTTQRTLDSRYS